MRLFELRNIFGVEKFDMAVKIIPFNFHIPYTLSITELHAKFFIPFSHYMEKSNNTQAIELVHPDQFPSFSL